MSSVYLWATTLCAILVIASVVKILSPSERLMKTLNLCLGVFVLLSVISPLAKFINSLDFDNFEKNESDIVSEAQAEYDNSVLEETGNYINSYCVELLKSQGINLRDIDVIVAESENRGIYIRSVDIYMDKESLYSEEKIKEILSSNLLVEPQVIYE